MTLANCVRRVGLIDRRCETASVGRTAASKEWLRISTLATLGFDTFRRISQADAGRQGRPPTTCRTGNWRTVIYAVNEATGRRNHDPLATALPCPQRAASSAVLRSIGTKASSPAHTAVKRWPGPEPGHNAAPRSRPGVFSSVAAIVGAIIGSAYFYGIRLDCQMGCSAEWRIGIGLC